MKKEDFIIDDDYINDITSIDNTKAIFDKITIGINQPRLFFNPDGLHGKEHTSRVLKLLSLISCFEALSENEKTILAYAGLYHDIGRTNDFYDLTHGKKSYKKLVSTSILKSVKLDNEDLKIMKYIIENHCIPDEQGNKNIVNYDIKNIDKALKLYKIFKDADGLDRVRLGDLDEKYLRLQSSKRLIPIAEYLFFNSYAD